MMLFNPGLAVEPVAQPLGFQYGEGIFGPEAERRALDAIRPSLLDPDCEGPETVYAIAMDVGKEAHRQQLRDRMLLFGVVTYAAGTLGREPIRSQGHIHRVSAHSGWSPPEVYEIWTGSAFIYMQETAQDDPGRCYAVRADPGDAVVVPPGWAHATISANPEAPLTFGAWCDREYGFEYADVRRRKGLAWYPLVEQGSEMKWMRNDRYAASELIVKSPGDYAMLGIRKGVPVYGQFEADPACFQWVSRPYLMKHVWKHFIP